MPKEPRLVKHHGVYSIVWYDDGKRHYTSTGTRNRAEAEAFFGEWKRHREKRVRGDTISAIIDAYSADKTETKAHRRIKSATKHIKARFGNKLPQHFSKQDSRDYVASRKDQVHQGTIRKELATLKTALRWAEKEGWLDRAPYVELPSSPPPRERFLTRAEADLLLGACVTAHVRLFILLGLHTGARMEAILSLRWGQVDMERRKIDYGIGWKIKRRAIVPINDTLFAALETARRDATCDWVVSWGGRRILSVYRPVVGAAERAGLKDVTPHVLRHTACVWMAEARVPITEISAMLGHTNPMTTARVYMKYSPDYLRKAADTLG